MYVSSLHCGIFDWFKKTPEKIERTFEDFKKSQLPRDSAPFSEKVQAPPRVSTQQEASQAKKPEVSAQTMPSAPSFVNVSIVNTQDNSTQETPVDQIPEPKQEVLETPAQDIPASPHVSPQTYSTSKPAQAKVELPKVDPVSNMHSQYNFSKLKTIGCTIATVYACLQGYLWYLSHTLAKASSWSLWCFHTFPEGVRSVSQADIKAKLSEALTGTSSNPLQLRFDIEKEEERLKRYQTLVQVLQKIYVGKLFSYNAVLLQEIPRRLYRLERLKNAYAQTYAELG